MKNSSEVNVKVIGRTESHQPIESETYQLLIPEGEEDQMHEEVSKRNPDHWVNFSWGNGSFIMGVPHNMKRDEELLSAGLIDWEEYKRKWYPGI